MQRRHHETHPERPREDEKLLGMEERPMVTTEKNADRIDRVWSEALENGRLEVIDDVMASDYVGHTPGNPEPLRGPEEFKGYVRMLREGFPDISVTIDDRIIGEDAIVDRYTIQGTHEGEFRGIAPTGAEVTLTGTVIHYMDDGKCVTDVSEFDLLGLMQQLGVVEPPGE